MIMRFKLVLLLLLFSAYVGKAQTGYGIRGGLNLSGLTTDQVLITKNEPKLGWQAGVYVKSLDIGWGFWAESSINVLGSSRQIGDEFEKNTIGYLSFPLGLHYTTANKFSFYLGGYLALRLWATSRTQIPGVGNTKANIKDNVALIDYGPWVGISYTFKRYIFDWRYMQGIANVLASDGRAFNVSTQLSVGYYLGRRNQRF